jgi:outer membrane immunogenic protein
MRCDLNRFFRGTCVLAFALVALCSAKAQDFKGFYIGGYAGGNPSTSDAHTFTVFSSAPTAYFAPTSIPAIAGVGNMTLNPSSFSGGGTVGLNLQHNALVIGVEADFGSMSLSESKTGTATYPCCAPTAFTITQSVKTDWLITVRPRVGFVFGPVLFYGTGGLAATYLNYQAVFTDTFASATENGGVDSTRKGWTGGAGAEMKLHNKHWSIKGEYLHADFGQVQTTSTNLAAPAGVFHPVNVFTHNADLASNLFRFGLNYRF